MRFCAIFLPAAILIASNNVDPVFSRTQSSNPIKQGLSYVTGLVNSAYEYVQPRAQCVSHGVSKISSAASNFKDSAVSKASGIYENRHSTYEGAKNRAANAVGRLESSAIKAKDTVGEALEFLKSSGIAGSRQASANVSAMKNSAVDALENVGNYRDMTVTEFFAKYHKSSGNTQAIMKPLYEVLLTEYHDDIATRDDESIAWLLQANECERVYYGLNEVDMNMSSFKESEEEEDHADDSMMKTVTSGSKYYLQKGLAFVLLCLLKVMMLLTVSANIWSALALLLVLTTVFVMALYKLKFFAALSFLFSFVYSGASTELSSDSGEIKSTESAIKADDASLTAAVGRDQVVLDQFVTVEQSPSTSSTTNVSTPSASSKAETLEREILAAHSGSFNMAAALTSSTFLLALILC